MGDQRQLRVGHAPVDDREQGEQPVPGQVGVVELGLVAAGVGHALLEFRVQASGRVGRRVQLVVAGSRPLSSANSRNTRRIITVTAPR